MGADEAGTNPAAPRERRVLLQVLALNLILVVSLTIAGILADSSGLIATALDNASDSAVYVVSYLGVGRSRRRKSQAAAISGILLLVLAAGVLGDAYRRFATGAEPVGAVMVVMSVIASAVNLWCLRLLGTLEAHDVNIRAAGTFSLNDFVSNIGVLVAGALVAWTGWLWPDLAVGAAIAVISITGGIRILRDARRSR